MSEKASREGLTRRSSFWKTLNDSALPPDYLDALEQKRKQLDESIHKYIASKEREYKQYEKDLKQQHRVAQGQDGTNDAPKRRTSSESTQDGGHNITWLEAERASAVDALLAGSSGKDSDRHVVSSEEVALPSQNRSALAGLRDRRASLERDKDFEGVFTPPYLSALDDRYTRLLERTTSAPQVLTKQDPEEHANSMERANSDSVVQAKPKRPSELALAHRTSSSGSSADGRLASAMKSPTQIPRPKRKRVSLAVGDSIVAPSDNVPVALSHNSTPSHSRIRSPVLERAVPAVMKGVSSVEQPESFPIAAALQKAEQLTPANPPSSEDKDLQSRAPAAIQASPSRNRRPDARSSNIDPDGDLFDLDDESDIPHDESSNDEIEGTLESEDEIAGRVGREEDSDGERYDPEAGIIPEPEDGTDSAVPYLAFGPSSAVASQQPTQPGFRRPSVVHDPVFLGDDYEAAEEDAVEEDVYGSSFNKPSKGSFTAGSLGESYMEKNAEERVRLRGARQQTQVRS